MEKLSKNHDLNRIKAIGGAAQVSIPQCSHISYLTWHSAASTSVVEDNSRIAFAVFGPSFITSPAAFVCLLPSQLRRRTGHVCTHSRSRAGGSPWRTGTHGRASGNVRAVKSYCCAAVESARSVVGCLEEHRPRAAGKFIYGFYAYWNLCWHG